MTLEQIIEDAAETDGQYAIAYALLRLASALHRSNELKDEQTGAFNALVKAVQDIASCA